MKLVRALPAYTPKACSAAIPRAAINGAAPPVSPSSTACMTFDCSSRSEGMGIRAQGVGLGGFGHEHLERGDIGVPLDQGRHVAEPLQRRAIHAPHRIAYRGAV